MDQFIISKHDRSILREVANMQLEYANMERNEKLIQEWYKHNELQGDRPLIHLELGTFAHELILGRMKCTGSYARQVEWTLYSNFLNQALFNDDKVTNNYYGMGYDTHFSLFQIPVQVTESFDVDGHKSVGHQFSSVITDLEEDYDQLKDTKFEVNIESTLAKKQILEETFGDILPIKLEGGCLYSVPTQMLVHIMSMENMMLNMYDYPELFKTVMNRIAEDTLSFYKLLEEKQIILPTNAGESLGQGSWCYNHTLPVKKDNEPITTKDVWGFMDSQETVGISPEMYEEFIFPTYKKISDCYGLLSYGCCEPVDPVWDCCISKLSNLRKVSISPWCKEDFMGERLRGSKIIYHRKPSPNFLGTGTLLEEDAVREHIRTSLKAAKGCTMEITQRDVYTINNDVSKAKRYIDIIKEEIENHW